MKKKVSLILAALLMVTGCTNTISEKPETKKVSLNLQEGDPPTLNPYVGVDLRSRSLFLALFEPLMRRKSNGVIETAAASSVMVDPTHTVYTFTLRDHHWSNGEKVLARHFADAWKFALTPGSHCFRADLFYLIKNGEKCKKGACSLDELGIEVVDNQTLKVTLEHPTPYFLEVVATSFYAPLYNPSEKEPEVFNGPFVVKKWLPDQLLVFERNPHYWAYDSLGLDEIHFTMVKDPNTAFALYEKGELDLVGDPLSSLPFDLIPTLENKLQHKPISRIFYLLLNSDSYPLNSKSLRRALSLSIDRNAICEHLFFGEIPTHSLIPATLSQVKTNLPTLSDADYAELIHQACIELNTTKEQLPKLVFSYAELSGQKKLAEFLQSEWKEKLGLDVELVCQEWNVHSANLRRGNYQMGTLHLTTLFQDPMFYFDLYRDKKALCNYCRWEDEEFKSLLSASETTTNLKERAELLLKAEELLLEEMPAIALFTQNLQYLIRDGLNLNVTDLGIYDFRHASYR